MVKKAACLANVEMGLIPTEIGAAVVQVRRESERQRLSKRFSSSDKRVAHRVSQACDDVIAGELLDQFIVDMIQGGAVTPQAPPTTTRLSEIPLRDCL